MKKYRNEKEQFILTIFQQNKLTQTFIEILCVYHWITNYHF